MSTKVNLGWLSDTNGNKIAPKTLISQVISDDGVALEEKLDNIHVITEDNKNEDIPEHAVLVVDTTEDDLGGGGVETDYILTEQDKSAIAAMVLANFIDVTEVAL
jgi:hypothetical protein